MTSSQVITGTDLLYQAHVRTVMLGMGYQPALIDPPATTSACLS